MAGIMPGGQRKAGATRCTSSPPGLDSERDEMQEQQVLSRVRRRHSNHSQTAVQRGPCWKRCVISAASEGSSLVRCSGVRVGGPEMGEGGRRGRPMHASDSGRRAATGQDRPRGTFMSDAGSRYCNCTGDGCSCDEGLFFARARARWLWDGRWAMRRRGRCANVTMGLAPASAAWVRARRLSGCWTGAPREEDRQCDRWWGKGREERERGGAGMALPRGS